ncbi:hypothetical protein GCM10022247_71130 [Allokutzneria multivorans]|uniref:Uncharacterized protein n=1 Tax=Allokutzneria multivorans TaxID=1142134 RepID=A0ABP7U3C5_9PSEU
MTTPRSGRSGPLPSGSTSASSTEIPPPQGFLGNAGLQTATVDAATADSVETIFAVNVLAIDTLIMITGNDQWDTVKRLAAPGTQDSDRPAAG